MQILLNNPETGQALRSQRNVHVEQVPGTTCTPFSKEFWLQNSTALTVTVSIGVGTINLPPGWTLLDRPHRGDPGALRRHHGDRDHHPTLRAERYGGAHPARTGGGLERPGAAPGGGLRPGRGAGGRRGAAACGSPNAESVHAAGIPGIWGINLPSLLRLPLCRLGGNCSVQAPSPSNEIVAPIADRGYSHR